MVDVAVGLVEVAVVVDVVAVPDVVLRERVPDLRGRLTCGGLGGDPRVHAVPDQVPGVAADVARAREAVAAAVAGLVVADLDRLGDRPLDRVATRRLRLVVLPHRLAAGDRAVAEVEVLVVRAAVVVVPVGAVVDPAVGLRDLVEQRSVEPGRPRCALVGVLVGVGRVPLVAELDQQDEQPVGVLTAQLDVLVLRRLGRRSHGGVVRGLRGRCLADLDHRAVTDPLGGRLALEDGRECLLPQRLLLLGERARQRVTRWRRGLRRHRGGCRSRDGRGRQDRRRPGREGQCQQQAGGGRAHGRLRGVDRGTTS